MNRNFDLQFSTFDGTPIDHEGSVFTLKRASVNALLTPFDDERNLPGEKKLERYKLASRIYAGGNIDVTAEEISLLKDLLSKAYSALIVGQAYIALEKDATQ